MHVPGWVGNRVAGIAVAPEDMRTATRRHPDLMMVAIDAGISGEHLRRAPRLTAVHRDVVTEAIRGQRPAGVRSLALPACEHAAARSGELHARLTVALGCVFADRDRRAPGGAVVRRTEVVGGTATHAVHRQGVRRMYRRAV